MRQVKPMTDRETRVIKSSGPARVMGRTLNEGHRGYPSGMKGSTAVGPWREAGYEA